MDNNQIQPGMPPAFEPNGNNSRQPRQPLPPVNAVDAIKKALTTPLDLAGRSRRSEFWWFTLFYYVMCQLGASLFQWIAGESIGLGAQYAVMIALVMPMLAVQVRRLHDAGHGAWWAWVFLVLNIGLYGSILPMFNELMQVASGSAPDVHAMERMMRDHSTAFPIMIVSSLGYSLWGLILLIFNLQDSEPGINQYGESPKYKL